MSKRGTILKCGYGGDLGYWLTEPAVLFNRTVIINDRVYYWFGCNPHEVALRHNGLKADDVVMLRTDLLEEYDHRAIQARSQRQFGVEFAIYNFSDKEKIGLTPRQIHNLLGGQPPPRWLRLFTLECILDLELGETDEEPPLLSCFDGDKEEDQFRFHHQLTLAAESDQGLPPDEFFDDVSVRDAASAALALLEHAGGTIVKIKDLAHHYDSRDTRRRKEIEDPGYGDQNALEAARARMALRRRNEDEAETLSCGTDWAKNNLRSIACTTNEQGWTTEEIASLIESSARTAAIDALSDQDLNIALHESFARAARGDPDDFHIDVLSHYLSRNTAYTLEVIGGMALTTAIACTGMYPSTFSM